MLLLFSTQDIACAVLVDGLPLFYPRSEDQVKLLQEGLDVLVDAPNSVVAKTFLALLTRLLLRYGELGAVSQVLLPGPDAQSITGWYHRSNAQRVYDACRLDVVMTKVDPRRLGAARLLRKGKRKDIDTGGAAVPGTPKGPDSAATTTAAAAAAAAVAAAATVAGSPMKKAGTLGKDVGGATPSSASTSPSASPTRRRRLSLSFEWSAATGRAGSDALRYVRSSCRVQHPRRPVLAAQCTHDSMLHVRMCASHPRSYPACFGSLLFGCVRDEHRTDGTGATSEEAKRNDAAFVIQRAYLNRLQRRRAEEEDINPFELVNDPAFMSTLFHLIRGDPSPSVDTAGTEQPETFFCCCFVAFCSVVLSSLLSSCLPCVSCVCVMLCCQAL